MKQVPGKIAALFAMLLLATAVVCAQTAAPAANQPSGQAAQPSQSAPSGTQAQPQQPNGSREAGAAAAPDRANGANGNGASAADTATPTSPATAQDPNAQNGTTQNAGNSLPWLWIAVGIAVVVLLLIAALAGRGRSATTVIDRNDRINDGPIVDRTDRTAVIDRDRVVIDRDDRDDLRRVG